MSLPQNYGVRRPSYPNRNQNNRRSQFNRGQPQGPRRNERIKAPEVRVIGPDGQQIGIMPTHLALQRARDYRLDLVEIAATARPPVCRIVDFGKYQYEESKKQKKQKAATVRLKEVKLRPRCDVHDLMIKIRRAENFLYHGHKLKLILSFRYRELEHPEIGIELMKRAMAELTHIGTPDHPARLMGRSMTVMLTPVAQGKRKLLHNTAAVPVDEIDEEEEDEDEDDDGGDDKE
ncbi:MAG: translation initiation factor IF-3 [Puniceicoccales bacterium]|jgi:translation initiation factor IF-3|nr:translation initiation factor IF-3 [Puniceicoccales bacterium]